MLLSTLGGQRVVYGNFRVYLCQHHAIFKKAGLPTTTYRYLAKDMTLDIDGMLEDLRAAPKGSTFVLHTVAHNPTGVDPSAFDACPDIPRRASKRPSQPPPPVVGSKRKLAV